MAGVSLRALLLSFSQLVASMVSFFEVAYDIQWTPDFEEGDDHPVAPWTWNSSDHISRSPKSKWYEMVPGCAQSGVIIVTHQQHGKHCARVENPG